jgi:hypothetical protein
MQLACARVSRLVYNVTIVIVRTAESCLKGNYLPTVKASRIRLHGNLLETSLTGNDKPRCTFPLSDCSHTILQAASRSFLHDDSMTARGGRGRWMDAGRCEGPHWRPVGACLAPQLANHPPPLNNASHLSLSCVCSSPFSLSHHNAIHPISSVHC